MALYNGIGGEICDYVHLKKKTSMTLKSREKLPGRDFFVISFAHSNSLILSYL